MTEAPNESVASAKPDWAKAKLLIDLWMHQNTLMWSRVQLLAAVQGAAFTANYVLHHSFASIGVCVAAAAATCFLIYISNVDRLIRDKYSSELKKHDFQLGFTPEERSKMYVRGLGFPLRASIHAETTLLSIFWSFIIVDVVVLIASLAVFR